MIIVLDNDGLFMKFNRDYKHLILKKLPKSGGVVQKEDYLNSAALDNYIQKYFIGSRNEIKSSKVLIPFNEIEIYQITSNSIN